MTEALGIAVPMVAKWEGFSPTPYLCPAKKWTIGYGQLCRPDTPSCTEPQARAWLEAGLLSRFQAACAITPELLSASPRRQAALMSWLYNLGVGNWKASSLRRSVAEGDWTEAARQTRRWAFAGGKKLRGLELRRAEEAALILEG